MNESRGQVLMLDPVHVRLQDGLRAAGYEVNDMLDAELSDIEAAMPEALGLLIRSRFEMNAMLLSKAEKLEWIARYGVGLDHVDLDYCHRRGIRVHNAKGGNAQAVGEHVLGMIIGLLRHQHRASTEVKGGVWRREANRGQELRHRSLGIIGFGHTGQALARCASGFGTRILAHDPYAPVEMAGVEAASAADIQAHCDIISFHVPLTAETRHYFDVDFLNQMARPFYFINASRGEVASTAVIADGLSTGRILGAGLDVMEEEQADLAGFHDSEALEQIKGMDNVILTPHIAGWSQESFVAQAEILLERILELS